MQCKFDRIKLQTRALIAPAEWLHT